MRVFWYFIGQTNSVTFERSYFISQTYSTVTEYLNEWVLFQILSFDLTLSSQNLRTTRYSKYQYDLYTKITYLQKQGMNYVEIANWLNRNKYKTPRGHIFKNNHVQSILKKRRNRLKIWQTEPHQSLSNIRLRYERTKFVQT